MLGWAWLHLATLWAFAFAKPLFDVVADSPEFFVARGNTRGDILVFAFAMVLVPPTAMVAVEALALRAPRVRLGLHLAFVAALAAALFLQVLDDAVGVSGRLLIVVSALAGIGAAVAYARTRVVPSTLTVLAPAPLVFLVIFLLISPVSKLVLPQGVAEAANAGIRSKTPVVLVVFDEFDPNMLMDRHERIDRSRYPHIAALADDATWYRNATTVNGATTMAVPAVLSATRPSTDQLPIAADYPNNVFTLLGDSHAMDATETATEVCPEKLCGARQREPARERLRSLAKDLGIVSLHLLAPEDLRSGLPAVDQTFGDFGDAGASGKPTRGKQPDVPSTALRNRVGQFGAILRGISRDRDRAALHFVHIALPHLPWEYLPSGQQYINNGPSTPGLTEERWAPDPFFARLGLQRHLLQVGLVDRLVGELTRRLRAVGIYDRAMVVVTADHGVSYRPGLSRRGPTPENGSDIAGVPLFIKYPHERRGHVDNSMVENIDVVPTIADRLGARLPWKADGRPIGGDRAARTLVQVGSGGHVFTLPFTSFVHDRRAGLRRMVSLFGSDDGGAGLYAAGAGGELIGRDVRSLRLSAGTGSTLELDSAEALDHFRPDSRLVPSFVTGRVTGGTPAGTQVAIAVNGRVRGTSETFQDGEDVRIAGFVPPSSFRSGSNSLDVFAVAGPAGSRHLARIATQRPDAYRLVQDGEGVRIVGGTQTARVQPGALEGYVDVLEKDDQGVRLGGWAVDLQGRRPAERVVVFDGTRLVAQGRLTTERPDIVQRYGSDRVARSGYEVRGSAKGAELDHLRVFALSGDRATELPHFKR